MIGVFLKYTLLHTSSNNINDSFILQKMSELASQSSYFPKKEISIDLVWALHGVSNEYNSPILRYIFP